MAPPSSPPSSPPEDASNKHSHDDERVTGMGNANEKISPLDPRRFTPTLHASLVAEILSLRRDVESKTADINHLEEALYNVKTENDTLTVDLAAKNREARTLKHEMKLLEGGIETALIDVAKERDKALDIQSDLRNRLEASQRKVNAQQEEFQRNQDLWQHERHACENDRRQLERQVHVMEGRLRTVLNEIAKSQANNENEAADQVPSLAEVKSKRHFHKRKASTTSTGTIDSEGQDRFAFSTSLGRANSIRTTSGNLADELVFDEDDEPEGRDPLPGDDEFDSSDALPEERSSSVLSRPMDLKARRLLGLSTDNFGFGSSQSAEQDIVHEASRATPRDTAIEETSHNHKSVYRDIGVQYTPPPSPSLEPNKVDEHISNSEDSTTSQATAASDHEPDDETLNSASSKPWPHHAEIFARHEMVSCACQTTEDSTPPMFSAQGVTPTSSMTKPQDAPPEMRSVETQTDEAVSIPQAQIDANEMSVPIIAIHPPSSRPSTPNTSVVLPPRTKNASCQVMPTDLCSCRSIAVQTDVIRVDKRIFSQQPSVATTGAKPAVNTIQPRPPPQSKSLFSRANTQKPIKPLREPPPIPPAVFQMQQLSAGSDKVDYYPGNNDNGLLTEDSKADTKRPFRTSSLFAGFDTSVESKGIQGDTTPFDEDDIFTRPTVTYTLKAGKLVAKQPTTANFEEAAERSENLTTELSVSSQETVPQPSNENGRGRETWSAIEDKNQPIEKPRPLKLVPNLKQPDFRRAAMVSNSTAAHQLNRMRSPSLPATEVRPPFPVPTRHSSRNLPLSGSEGMQSPTRTNRIQIKRVNSHSDLQGRNLRKVRSTTSLNPLHSSADLSQQSPSLMSPLSDDTGSPSLPPLPSNEVIWPRDQHYMKPSPHRFYDRSNTDPTDTAFQQTTVVDAIAQTMVGEWMWKYVRRRKSFGVSDSRAAEWELGKSSEELSAHITSTGVRHKRWVWVEPYERAVMWSSKQPTSGMALLGKNGRKLAIQSVLDVRDDNPLPKSAAFSSSTSPTGASFNRSILILTPQRALKFTAATQERHYVWLNALSFLSHSPLSINDLSPFHSSPHDEYPAPAPPVHGGTGSLRRSHVRDSIRVAKAKDKERIRPGLGGPRSFTNDGILRHKGSSIESPPLYYGPNSPILDAADPPIIPRVSARKRSNTVTSSSTKGAPRTRPAIPGAFRSYSASTTPAIPPPPVSATFSIASSDMHSSSRLSSARDSLSRQPSENSMGSPVSGMMVSKHFDNLGTIRMEAFIGQEERERKLNVSRGLRKGKRKDMGALLDEMSTRGEDPFKGF